MYVPHSCVHAFPYVNRQFAQSVRREEAALGRPCVHYVAAAVMDNVGTAASDLVVFTLYSLY